MKKYLISFLVAALMFCTVGIEESAAQPAPDVDPLINPVFRTSPVDVSDWLDVIPNLKQGGMYSVPDKVVKYCSTTVALEDIFDVDSLNVEIGGAPVYNELLVGVSYEVIKVRDYVKFPLLDLIELNVGYTLGVMDLFEENEFDHGPWATAVNVKF